MLHLIARIATACRLLDAIIGLEATVSGIKGDVMADDQDTIIQPGDLRAEYFGRRSAYDQMMPKAEMHVGEWYVDEFGNQSREIKARD
jgi:hypothetical protein